MKCPKCGNTKDKVVDSRTIRDGEVVRRRRVCEACQHRFTTYEEVIKTGLMVIKRDGRMEAFDRKNLESGIRRACKNRPISSEQIQVIVDRICRELDESNEREVKTTLIGTRVMEELKKIDEVAYVRFASVYRRYRDINQFLSEVEGLIQRD